MDWPIDQERPSPSSLYNWLNQATLEKRVRREGRGISGEPRRYRLPNKQAEYYDRGKLPQLRSLRDRQMSCG